MFSINDFWDLVTYASYFTLKFIGMAPFSFTRKEPNGRINFQVSVVGAVYNFVFLAYLVISGVSLGLHMPEIKTTYFSSVSYASNFTYMICCLITCSTIVISSCLYQENFIEILKTLTAIDHSFPSKMKYTNMHITVIFYSITIGVSLFYNFRVNDQIFSINEMVILSVNFVIFNVFILQYFMVVEFIYVKFQMINDKLLEMAEKIPTLRFVAAYDERKTLHVEIFSIMKFRTFYKNMTKVSEQVNNYFSVPILPCLVTSLYCLTNNCYSLIGQSWTNVDHSIACIVWIFTLLFPAWRLSRNVDRVLKEVFINKLRQKKRIGFFCSIEHFNTKNDLE